MGPEIGALGRGGLGGSGGVGVHFKKLGLHYLTCLLFCSVEEKTEGLIFSI